MRQSQIDHLLEKQERLLEILEGIDSLNSRAKSYCRSYYQFQDTEFNEMAKKFKEKYNHARSGVNRLYLKYQKEMED